MKYLNIKKALAAWQNLQPLSEKDKEKLAVVLLWTSTTTVIILKVIH